MNYSKINISFLVGPQFNYAESYQKKSRDIKIFGFIANIIVIILATFLPEYLNNSFISILVLLVGVSIIVLDYYFDQQFKYNHSLGERIKKIELIRKSFGYDNLKSEEIELKELLKETVILNAKQSYNNEKEINDVESISTFDFYSDQTNLLPRFAEHLQENCYFTSFYLRKFNREVVLKDLMVFIAILFPLLLVSFYFFVTTDYNLLASQFAAIIFSAFISFNLIPYFFVNKEKRIKLSKLEGVLDKYKKNPDIKMEELMYYLAEYTAVTIDMYQCSGEIYKKYNEEVNTNWKHKVDSD